MPITGTLDKTKCLWRFYIVTAAVLEMYRRVLCENPEMLRVTIGKNGGRLGMLKTIYLTT
jgi:hypothetical protein